MAIPQLLHTRSGSNVEEDSQKDSMGQREEEPPQLSHNPGAAATAAAHKLGFSRSRPCQRLPG